MHGNYVKSQEDLNQEVQKILEPGNFNLTLSIRSIARKTYFFYLNRQTILQIMSIFAVLVNSGIIAFTGTYTNQYRWSVRVWIFITFAAGVLVYVKIFLSFSLINSIISFLPPFLTLLNLEQIF